MAATTLDLRRVAREAYARSDADRLRQACEGLLRASPDDAEARRLMGRMALRDQRPDLAEPWFREAAARAPDEPGAWSDLARALSDMRRDHEAEAQLAAASSRGVRSPATLTFLGQLQVVLGRIDDARATFEAALDEQPLWGEALLGLAWAGGLRVDSPRYRQTLRLMAETPELNDAPAAAALYALAEAEWREGAAEGFITRLTEANARQARLQRTGQDWTQLYKRARKAITPETLGKFDPAQDAPFAPVFLVGAPQSGIAALAHALSLHPDVGFSGPLPFLANAVARALEKCTRKPAPEGVEVLSDADRAGLAEAYIERAQRIAPKTRVLIDATPDNAHLTGLIPLLFGNAKVIHVDREAMDQGFAVFRSYHPRAEPETCDLTKIAKRRRRFAPLAEHVRTLKPATRFVTSLERLREAPVQEMERILAFLTLSFRPACANALVEPATPRQFGALAGAEPIMVGQGARWSDFAEALKPLQKGLGVEGPRRPS